MKRFWCFFLCAICASGWVQGAEKDKKDLGTQQPVVIDSTPLLIKQNEAPAGDDSPPKQTTAPALDNYQSYATPVPQKVPDKKFEPDEQIKPDKPSAGDHALDRPAPERKQAPELVNLPQDNLSGQQDAIRDANQARIFEEAREAAEALRQLSNEDSSTNPDLGLGGSKGSGIGGRDLDDSKLPGHDVAGFETPEGAEYLPDLPDNQDQGPSGSALRPSGNLAGIMGGAASQDSGVIQMEEQHIQGDKEQRTQRNPDGSTTTTTIRTNPDGSRRVDQETTQPDGQVTYRRQIWVDNQDNVTRDRVRSWREDGQRESRWQRGPLDPNQMQDPNNPNYSPEFARWASQFDHSAKKGARDPNRVNPGPEGAMENPQAPRLAPGDEIVINPSTENAGSETRELSDAQREALAEQLREEVKGPGGHPGDTPTGTQLDAGMEGNQSQ